jgi:hypothetical protein
VFTHHVARGHAALRAGVVDNLHSEIGGFNGRPLAFYLLGESAHLLLQGAKEELKPRLPIWRFGFERALRLAQREVISL